jgi:predicted small lipoprotein YifL
MKLKMNSKNITVLITLLLLSGCGIKPSNVSAPPETAKDSFPHVYPDPQIH